LGPNMDISRLPAAPVIAAAGTTQRKTTRVAADTSADTTARVHTVSSPKETGERVIQGELLQRERAGAYQSTRGFLNERGFDQAAAGDRHASRQSRSAISHYLTHARSETTAELTQGRSVNYFV